jgi:hypothetical protein
LYPEPLRRAARRVAGLLLGALAGLAALALAPEAQAEPVTLAQLQAACQKDCRLVTGDSQKVAGDELTPFSRQLAGGTLELGLHSQRAGVVPASGAAAHLTALLGGRAPSIDEAKAIARLLLVMRMGTPDARVITTPEELPRLAGAMRRRVRQDSWPRTDPRPAGRFLVTAVMQRELAGHHRLDRLLMVVEPGAQWLAGSEVLHCEPGFPGGCGLVGIP